MFHTFTVNFHLFFFLQAQAVTLTVAQAFKVALDMWEIAQEGKFTRTSNQRLRILLGSMFVFFGPKHFTFIYLQTKTKKPGAAVPVQQAKGRPRHQTLRVSLQVCPHPQHIPAHSIKLNGKYYISYF